MNVRSFTSFRKFKGAAPLPLNILNAVKDFFPF